MSFQDELKSELKKAYLLVGAIAVGIPATFIVIIGGILFACSPECSPENKLNTGVPQQPVQLQPQPQPK